MLSAWLNRYYGRLRRPVLHFPGSPDIGRHAPAADAANCRAGEASPVPAVTLDTFRAPYTGKSLTGAAGVDGQSIAEFEQDLEGAVWSLEAQPFPVDSWPIRG
jgi:hypothetical protein